MEKKNVYTHEIDLKKLFIQNMTRAEFAKEMRKSLIEVMK
jgi:hypothetical protein